MPTDATIVSGVPGVGSSRVCQTARRRLDDSYELINFGDVMLEEALTSMGVDNRDDLARLSIRQTRVLQRRAGEYIAALMAERDRSFIVNTHLVVNTTRGFLPGLPDTVLSDVTPDCFVLIEAEPEMILERRDSSDYRQYAGDDALGVEFQQDLSRSAAMGYATAMDAPIRLVENTGSLEDAADRLADIVDHGSG